MKAHASGIIGGAAVSGVLGLMQATNVAHYATVVASWVQQAKDFVEQIDHMKKAAKRYYNNLKAIMDVNSFQGFMDWYNRSLYIEQEAMRIYDSMGVRIGGKKYDLTDIDKIPDALRNEFTDPHWGDIAEEETYAIWRNLGLSPSNYFYLKTWEKRNEDIKKRFVAGREMHGDEIEEAAARNNDVLKEYSDPFRKEDDIDSNKIAMNAHSTQMQIEMVLRDLSLSLDDLKDYIVSRDEANKVHPNAMVPSESWNINYFKPITGGRAQNSFSD
jgi:hypothetical protein